MTEQEIFDKFNEQGIHISFQEIMAQAKRVGQLQAKTKFKKYQKECDKEELKLVYMEDWFHQRINSKQTPTPLINIEL